METRVYTLVPGGDAPEYMIIAMNLAAAPDGKVGDPAAELRGMGPQLAERFGGKLVRESPVTIAGGEGRDFLIEVPEGAEVAARIVYAHRRMIQLYAFGKGARAVAEANGFFDSLRVDP
jgi:hypothetical protein